MIFVHLYANNATNSTYVGIKASLTIIPKPMFYIFIRQKNNFDE